MIPFSIFLGDEYLGDGLQADPESTHYLCVQCGEIWARVVSSRQSQHHAWHGFCPRCSTPESWSPAVICQDFRFRTYKWPKAALIRDFLFLMELKAAPVISNNLPEISHEYQATA